MSLSHHTPWQTTRERFSARISREAVELDGVVVEEFPLIGDGPVFDDFPQVLEAFGGSLLSAILKQPEDRELLEVLRLVEEMANGAAPPLDHAHEGIEVLVEGLSDLDETVEPEGR